MYDFIVKMSFFFLFKFQNATNGTLYLILTNQFMPQPFF